MTDVTPTSPETPASPAPLANPASPDSTACLVLVANAGDSTISTLRLEGQRLTPLQVRSGLDGTGTFVLTPSGTGLHAAVKGDPAAVVTLDLDPSTGTLSEQGRSAVESSMTYLATTPDGRFLLGASYGGGVGLVWPLGAGGTLGKPTARIEFPNLHCVVVHGEHAYFVSLGADLVAQYRLGGDGDLAPLDPPTVAAPAGSGPRHLVVHPDGHSAYLMTEFSAEAIRFDRDIATGALTRAEALPAHDTGQGLGHSRIGIDPLEHHVRWGADLHLTPDARRLVCSERTCSTLTTIELDERGRLVRVLATTPTEQQPRGFALTPNGEHVIAVGEKSTQVALSRLEDDGSLTLLDRVPGGRGANWVRTLPLT